MSVRNPVLLIGLDASDAGLIHRLIDQGRLPALAKLRAQGCHARLASPADRYAGGVWPSFYTGRDVPWHGIYHNKLWRPDSMRCEVPTDRWLPSRPFWESWADPSLRVCVIDVPMILGQPRPVNGIYLGGWGTHDLISRGSWPASIWKELAARHGPPRMPRESYGLQTAGSLLALRDDLLRATQQMKLVASDLLTRERWDFACLVLGGIHRMGHYLTDLSQVTDGESNPRQRAVLENALVGMYEATDEVLAHLLERVSSDTQVLVFAVHGMSPNPGWSDLVPDILAALQRAASGRRAPAGLLYTIKRAIPMHWARPVLRHLPHSLNDRLVSLWSARMFDWRSTRTFPMPMDHAAYLRINLAGRERDGIVTTQEYEEACAGLEALFTGMRDGDSGREIGTQVSRAFADAPAAAPQRALLPDVLVSWPGLRATQVRRLVCDPVPGFRFNIPARLPSGRSGNHVGEGWLIAAGPGISPGRLDAVHDICDLAPTVLRELGTDVRDDLPGRPIDWSKASPA